MERCEEKNIKRNEIFSLDQVKNFEGASQISTTSQGLFRKGVCGGGTPQIRNSQKSAKHPSLHITFNEIFGGHLYGRFAKGGEVPSFPQLFGENPILKEVGGR